MGVKFNPFTSKLDIVDSPSGEFSDIELALGTQTAPSLSFTGDPNTGIYSPGGDQLAISTNGTGRLFVNASGDVGINEASPSTYSAGTGVPSFVLKGSSGSYADRSGALALVSQDGTTAKTYIYHDTDLFIQSTEATNTCFYTNNTERLRITSDGNVGIGTGSPGTTLHVVGTTDGDAIRISQAGQVYKIGRRASDGALMFTGLQTQFTSFRFGTDGNEERVVFDPSGRVGIGTASPSYLLDVLGQARASSYLCGGGPGFTGYDFSTSGSGAGTANVFCPSGFTLAFGTNSTERARIDPSGRLLVGTSSESGNAKQVIRGNSGSSSGAGVLDIGLGATRPGGANIPLGYIRFTSTSNTSGNYHYAYIAAASDGTSSSDDDIPGRLVFATTADGALGSPTERMRITSGGQVWINTTTGTVNTSNYGTNIGLILNHARNTDGGNAVAQFHGNVGTAQVMGDGDLQNTSGSYGPISSDQRLKQDIVDAGTQWDDIKAVRLTKFRYKNNPTGELQLGPIAQELEQVSPNLITRRPASEDEIADPSNDLVDGDEVLSFKASILYMKAVKALQEAMERIEQLEAKVNALEGN